MAAVFCRLQGSLAFRMELQVATNSASRSSFVLANRAAARSSS